MKCSTCHREIRGPGLTAAMREFCSEVCHLRFWKNEMPNLGGRWIVDEDITAIENLKGEALKKEYERIVSKVINNLDNTALMINLCYGPPPGNEK
jgi:hypothetical protein